MRINRFLAASGLGSRRSCEEMILAGNVTINGQICQNLATEVGEKDFVKVGSRHIVPEKPFIFCCTSREGICARPATRTTGGRFSISCRRIGRGCSTWGGWTAKARGC